MDAGQREKDTRVGRSARKRETEIQQGRERERQTDVGERDVVRHRQRWRKRARWKSDIRKALHFNTLV